MFYLVDKPLGISSNLVAKILKRVLRVSKIGFAGTLDPLATGLMIIGTDGSSRLFPLMEHYTKTYETTIRLDGTSSSYDREQPIESIEVSKEIQKKLTKEYIESVISHNFLGDIMQIPPTYSATWIDGQRAYELARKWHTIDIKAKKRNVHVFDIVSYEWPQITAKITVSHGTYIRSLARDLWIQLQTGWYLESLRRTEIGHMSIEKHSWTQHNDILYTPIEHTEVFPNIPLIDLSEEQKKHLRLGSTPLETERKNGHYFIQYADTSYGLLESKEGLLFPVKNVV